MRILVLSLSILLLSSCTKEQKTDQKYETAYVCPPCSCMAHDNNQIFEDDGACPHCGMNLVEKTDSSQINQVTIKTGSGNFLVDGGQGHKEKSILVFYHKPKNYTSESPILIVVPGSGRDAGEYRDSWIKHSEKHAVLILSPKYTEQEYDFGDYHMGGLMYDMQLMKNIEYLKNSNEVKLDEENFTYKVRSNPEEWIFNDFDRLFEMVTDELGSSQTEYDIFGHSAGGQILHRFVLFNPDSKANRILASNSGFYTLPDFDFKLPFGLENTPLGKKDLQSSFKERLVLFIGELDNENETGGILLRSPTADKQGDHRLERAKYFYETAKEKAENLETEFNWNMVIIPYVGHDFKKMGRAAADYLYGT